MVFKKRILPLVLGCAFVYGGNVGFNAYNHHNVEINNRGDRTFEKIDGAFSHTSLRFRGNDSTLTRGPPNYRSFDDNGADGRVDRIFLVGNPFVRGSSNTSFDRDTDFNDYRAVFESADKELAEQLQRFSLDYKGNRLN